MNAKKLLSTLLSAAMAVSMLAGCFGGGGNKNYSDEAADAANAAQNTVVFSTDATLAKSLQDALADGLTQLDEIDDAMEADENLKPLLTSGWDLDIFAAQGEDAEAAAKTIAEQYIVSAVIGKKAEGKIAMVLHDGNGYYYVAVLTYGNGGSGSGGGAGGGSGSGDNGNRPGPGDDDDEENGVYAVDAKALDDNGTVEADKATVKAGETVTITVTPKDGYQIDKIDYAGGTFNYVPTGSGSGSGSLVYTMSNVTGDVKFHVTFFKEAAPDTSTVTFTVTGEGTVTNTANNSKIENGDTLEMVPAGKMTFKVNSDQYYEAVVTNEGCTVVDNKDGTYTLSNVTDGATVTVTFEEIVYEITVSSSSNGRTIVSTSKVHPAKGEDSVTITAKPDSGYEVDKVIVSTGDYEQTGDNTYEWTGIDGDANVRVTFKKSQYEFTLNITGEGKVKVGDKTYTAGENTFKVDAGETVSFEAVAGEHYEISSIKVDGQSQSDEFTVTADQARTIDVAFAPEVYDVTITTTNEGGTVTKESETVTYGETYTFTVEPEEGYKAEVNITNGSGKLESGENGEYTLTGATGDVEISVTFVRTSYNIGLTITGSGSVSYGSDTYTKSGTISVNPGQTATLNITADDGYKIAEVKVDGTSQDAANTVTFSNVNADHTVEVTFEPLKKYTVTVEKDKNSTGDGTVDKLGTNTVTEGDTFTFTAKPNDNKTTVKVTVDGDELDPTSSTANGNIYTISNINGNKKVIVTFTKETHSVTVNIKKEDKADGTVSYENEIIASGHQISVVHNGSVTLTVTPSSGSSVDVSNATDNGNGTYTISSVTSNETVTVTFRKPKVSGIDIDQTSRYFEDHYWCTEEFDPTYLKITLTYDNGTKSDSLTVGDNGWFADYDIPTKDITWERQSIEWQPNHSYDKKQGWYKVVLKVTYEEQFDFVTVYMRCNPWTDSKPWGQCEYYESWDGHTTAPYSNTRSAQKHG